MFYQLNCIRFLNCIRTSHPVSVKIQLSFRTYSSIFQIRLLNYEYFFIVSIVTPGKKSNENDNYFFRFKSLAFPFIFTSFTLNKEPISLYMCYYPYKYGWRNLFLCHCYQQDVKMIWSFRCLVSGYLNKRFKEDKKTIYDVGTLISNIFSLLLIRLYFTQFGFALFHEEKIMRTWFS